ncbi:hypothetical protein K491DRAFT_359256 [Lophiostoma macrostomum CBS 122681]|uniref:Uncharacterized protein n=1 Tax=Lophiostoma macrostomum CBS 122681 TaxID=1314788 RepID=A0A6A6TC37_9PLEO|nr:hypothetical protein K491DRAFT_359256 [Lophiostoma macrostomum CBS 122681]
MFGARFLNPYFNLYIPTPTHSHTTTTQISFMYTLRVPFPCVQIGSQLVRRAGVGMPLVDGLVCSLIAGLFVRRKYEYYIKLSVRRRCQHDCIVSIRLHHLSFIICDSSFGVLSLFPTLVPYYDLTRPLILFDTACLVGAQFRFVSARRGRRPHPVVHLPLSLGIHVSVPQTSNLFAISFSRMGSRTERDRDSHTVFEEPLRDC